MTARQVGYIRPELEPYVQPLTAVTPYPGNPRRGDHDTIRESLREHGQYKPLLAQASTGYLIGGNNTWQVMAELGWTHAAIVTLAVDDVRATKMLLIDNRSSDRADNDLPALVQLLSELPTFDGSGFTLPDLDAFLADLDDVDLSTLGDVTTALPPTEPAAPLPPHPTADPYPIPAPPPHTTVLPPTTPPTTRPAPAPTHDVPWVLTLTRADRDEAHRLIDHARDWLDDPKADPAHIVLTALRTLSAVGDSRHNTTATISLPALLMAAGRDPLRL